MPGALCLWDETRHYAAFEAGPPDAKVCVVAIGGLGDGLGSIAYINHMSAVLAGCGVNTVQFVMASSFGGFGVSSLQEDAQSISRLLEHLRTKHHKRKFFLLGHSTGCQDILYFFAHIATFTQDIAGIVLQGPSSDRAYKQAQNAAHLSGMLTHAQELVSSGRSKETFMPPAAESPTFPITAERFLSLYALRGTDDMFTSDLCDDEFALGFANVPPHCRLLIVFSAADETVPASVDAAEVQRKFRQAAVRLSACDILTIDGADHAISQESHQNIFIDAIRHFVTQQ